MKILAAKIGGHFQQLATMQKKPTCEKSSFLSNPNPYIANDYQYLLQNIKWAKYCRDGGLPIAIERSGATSIWALDVVSSRVKIKQFY